MKDRIKAVAKKIKNMKGRTWFLILFGLYFVFQFVLFPRIISTHYIYAEDGGIFIDGFQRSGAASFFEPFGGYIVLISRLFAAISVGVARVFNNFKLSFDALEVLSSLFIAFVFAYFASDRFKFLIKKRSRRMIVGFLALIMLSCFQGMLFCSVGIHWICGLLMFLVNLELMNDQLPPIRMYPFVVLCVLSSPSSLILGLGIAYYLIKKIFIEKNWRIMLNARTISFLVISIVTLAIQAFVILCVKQAGEGTEMEFTARRILNTSSAAYDLTVGSGLFIFTRSVFAAAFSNGIGPIVGGILWIIVIYLAKKKKMLRFALIALVSIFFVYFMTFFKRSTTEYEVLTSGWIHIFYNALPAVISIIIIPAVLLQYAKKKHLIIEVAILIAIIPHMITERWRPDYDGLNMVVLKQMNDHLDFNSDTFVPFIYGPHSYDVVHIPINTEYCHENFERCESL